MATTPRPIPLAWVAIGLLACTSTPTDTSEPDDTAIDTAIDTDTDTCSTDDYEPCSYPTPAYTVMEYSGYEFAHTELPRTMASTIRYPADATGALPVVIVSHGGSLNDTGHTLLGDWGRVLAEHGYVAIHVAHPTFPEERLPQFCAAFSVPEDECDLGLLNPPVALKPMDARVVLDALPSLNTWFEANTGFTLDVDRIGSLGWSGGSQVPASLGGARRFLSPSVAIMMTDERVDAGVVLSPQGPGFSGYYEDETGTSMDTVTRPLLIATGDNDWKESNEELLPEIRRETYENLPDAEGQHRLLYSRLPRDTGGHGTYSLGDMASSDADLQRLSLALISAVRAHLDAHLLSSDSASEYLDSQRVLLLAGEDRADWEAR